MPSGFGQGKPMRLREWQRELIRNTYDPVDDRGLRMIRTALWSMARKNGKTALAAALVLVHLVGPEAKLNAEVYSAASDRIQAGHIYKMASQMVALDPELQQLCKCIDTQKRIVCYHLGSFYVSLSADARRQHGFNPTFVIYDELAQALNRELYDVLSTSFGAQEEALLLVISTQSSDPQSIMTEMADEALKQMRGELDDPSFYGKVFCIPEDADPYDEANWPLANPALGDFRSIVDMRAKARKAKRSPSAEGGFKNLYCNMRVDAIEGLINSVDWRACQKKWDDADLIGRPMHLGLDLSSRQDLTSATAAWELPGIVVVRSWFWTHAHNLKERSKQDGAKYVEWEKAKHLFVCPGRSVDYGTVIKFLAKLIKVHELQGTAFDRWRIDQFTKEIERASEDPEEGGFTVEDFKLIEHGQGFKDMSPAIEKLEDLAVEHQLNHDGNPVLTYCLSNVRVIRDPAGGRKFDKRQRHRRIDGAQSLAMSLSAIDKADNEVEGPSIYERRGLVSV